MTAKERERKWCGWWWWCEWSFSFADPLSFPSFLAFSVCFGKREANVFASRPWSLISQGEDIEYVMCGISIIIAGKEACISRGVRFKTRGKWRGRQEKWSKEEGDDRECLFRHPSLLPTIPSVLFLLLFFPHNHFSSFSLSMQCFRFSWSDVRPSSWDKTRGEIKR